MMAMGQHKLAVHAAENQGVVPSGEHKEKMIVKKLKIKYGQLTVECGEMSWWAWGMLLVLVASTL